MWWINKILENNKNWKGRKLNGRKRSNIADYLLYVSKILIQNIMRSVHHRNIPFTDKKRKVTENSWNKEREWTDKIIN